MSWHHRIPASGDDYGDGSFVEIDRYAGDAYIYLEANDGDPESPQNAVVTMTLDEARVLSVVLLELLEPESVRCTTCGGTSDSPPCSLNRDLGWSGHTYGSGVAGQSILDE